MKLLSHPLMQLTLAASLGLSAVSGFAQTEAPKHGGMRQLDTNKDKQISREEAKSNPMLSKNFDAIDTNKDGQLSRDEMKAFHKANKVDQDGDGNISKAEAAKRPHLAKNFDAIDTNKDGILTPAERKAWMDQHKKK
jgi:Ca2+-binding EF-hand superfamily protein